MSSEFVDAETFLAEQRKAMPEEEWLQEVRDEAERQGWRHYHTRNSRGSDRGYPDLCMVRPPRIIYAELKSYGEKPTEDQNAWLRDFERCPPAEVYIWWPVHWDWVQEVLA